MRERGAEPFILALETLRARLRRGDFPLDARLAATELAADLGLSATPVREALSRLAGEGLLEDRRGQGFFVRRLTRRDIAALYRLSLAHQIIAAETAEGSEPVAPPEGEPVEASERLFLAWIAAAGARALSLSFARLQAQLGAVRRLEPEVLPDLAEELAELAASPDRALRLARLRAFHVRRIRRAERLADLLERSASARGIGSI